MTFQTCANMATTWFSFQSNAKLINQNCMYHVPCMEEEKIGAPVNWKGIAETFYHDPASPLDPLWGVKLLVAVQRRLP